MRARAEANWRYSEDRSILMTEFWVPLAQQNDRVLYGDLRMMGDNTENKEGNLGLGYRQIVDAPVLGEGVAGTHAWIDHRITALGSSFQQVTAGAEWLGPEMDLRLNTYVPLSNEKLQEIPNTNPQGPALVGTGIVVDTNGTAIEEPQYGFDAEIGWELGSQIKFVQDHTDSLRVYGGGFYFNSEQTESISGWRVRMAADVTENVQLGTRFQHDDVRGSQGFFEATIRFPFDAKKSYRSHGLRARLDESPERDIDIVTGKNIVDPGERVQVLNKETGALQQVVHVNNAAAINGNGSAETPFNNLLDAQNAVNEYGIIYVQAGTGNATNQNSGITLNKTGTQLIGTGSDFVYDSGTFSTRNGKTPTSYLIAAAGAAPVLGNTAGNGITINADNVKVSGVYINSAVGGSAILVEANGAAASAQNIEIENVRAENATRHGLYIHAANSGAVSARVESSVFTGNGQHGIAVYDDTDDTFEVDLGGGAQGSSGLNVLAGNALEDLAVEYDGRTLAAANNWWGQASGPDTDSPAFGIAPQIYYGAPLNDGLVSHFTMDAAWVSGNIMYDRSINRINAQTYASLAEDDLRNCQMRECLYFNPSTGAYAIMPTATHLPSGQISVISWINQSNFANWINFISNNWSSTASPTSWLLYSNEQGYAQFGMWGATSNPQQTATKLGLVLNQWNMLTATYNGNVTTSNFNLGTPATRMVGAQTLKTDGPIIIGDQGYGGIEMPYYMDDIRIYNRVITAAEEAELYRMNASSSVNVSGYLSSMP